VIEVRHSATRERRLARGVWRNLRGCIVFDPWRTRATHRAPLEIARTRRSETPAQLATVFGL
jgi:hypothetical protein